VKRTRTFALSLLLLALASSAHASWYDDYDAGLNAVKTGNWTVVVQRMTAAIKGNPNEKNKAKTYGTIFINYHPFYYRGVAYLNLGKYEQAVSDLEQALGPGPENLGSIEMLMDSAKTKLRLAEASTPPQPEPTRPEPVRPTPLPVTPAAPAIDPALKQRAAAALSNTKQKLQAAQQRKATASPQYAQAMSMFSDASTKNLSPKSNDDLNAIISIADNAGDLADLATAPAAIAMTPTPTPVIPKPSAATSIILADAQTQVRRALEDYFAGEFERATRQFQRLSEAMPKNAWIWAFLGASQYSQFAFEADETYRRAAIRSFQKAKQHRRWKDGLPSQYFSKRIRRAFSETAG
jgi:tetratricopeptide (TPR) repeat protein